MYKENIKIEKENFGQKNKVVAHPKIPLQDNGKGVKTAVQPTRVQPPTQKQTDVKQKIYTNCKHTNLIPYELKHGKLISNKTQGIPKWTWDWSASMMSASRSRVVTYFCADCQELIKAPEENVIKQIKKDR